jgi:hypothetical protein
MGVDNQRLDSRRPSDALHSTTFDEVIVEKERGQGRKLFHSERGAVEDEMARRATRLDLGSRRGGIFSPCDFRRTRLSKIQKRYYGVDQQKYRDSKRVRKQCSLKARVHLRDWIRNAEVIVIVRVNLTVHVTRQAAQYGRTCRSQVTITITPLSPLPLAGETGRKCIRGD